MHSVFDERHLRRALDLARLHHPHPNPRVGSLVVSPRGVVLGEGSHRGPGQKHAEVLALEEAGEGARGASLYVTLEPCAHHGRTPPCVDAIVAAGVERVIIGSGDPDSRVSGKGVAILREAGIEVVQDVLGEEARGVDPGYFHHRATGMPLVTMKYAMTLDGAVAARDGTSQWITSEQARLDAHLLRAGADAIIVGAGTLRSDDPRLDVRLDGYEGPQPRPVVIAGTSPLPVAARLWERDPLVVSSRVVDLPAGSLLEVDGEDSGLPAPRATCAALAEMGYLSILLEGGPRLAGSWWRAGVIARGVLYLGGKLGGGAGIPPIGGVFASIDEASGAKIVDAHTLGSDVRIDFERVGSG